MKKKKESQPRLSVKVVEYVLTRNTDQLATLTVESIATYLKVNRSHLSRCFKAEKKFTIEEFIFKIKIIHASSILKENHTITVKDVAQRLGFCRCDYFISIFKRYFGTTPAKYRDLVS